MLREADTDSDHCLHQQPLIRTENYPLVDFSFFFPPCFRPFLTFAGKFFVVYFQPNVRSCQRLKKNSISENVVKTMAVFHG